MARGTETERLWDDPPGTPRRTVNWGRRALMAAGVVGSLWIAAVLIALVVPGPNQAKATLAELMVTRTPRAPSPTATALTPQGQLAQVARQRLRDAVRSVTVAPDGVGTITYTLSGTWDEGALVRSAAMDFQQLAPEAFKVAGINKLDVVAHTGFIDVRGQSKDEAVTRFAITRAAAARINWSNVDGRNFGTLLRGADGDFYVHPAVATAWRDYAARR